MLLIELLIFVFNCLRLNICLTNCLSSFFFNLCAECVLLYSLHFLAFSYLPTIYECIYLSSLFLVHSVFEICRPLFCSGCWFVHLFISFLVIDFLMRLLSHLFDVRSLQKSLQTRPDFTDRIFRWTIHRSEPLRFQKILFACLFCHVFSYWFLFSIACVWILVYPFVYLVSFWIPVLNVFCFIPFISRILFSIYRLSMNVCIRLVYFSSMHCFTFFGLYFELSVDLSIYSSFFGYWLSYAFTFSCVWCSFFPEILANRSRFHR